MTVTQPMPAATQVRFVRPPRHRGERDYARDTLDWFVQTVNGHVSKGPGQHRENPYAAFRYIVKEK